MLLIIKKSNSVIPESGGLLLEEPQVNAHELHNVVTNNLRNEHRVLSFNLNRNAFQNNVIHFV